MKGCFLLQRRFSVLGHAIALILKEKYGLKEFCGYTYLRTAEKFLKSQKDIDYQPLLVEEDLYELVKKEKLDIPYLTVIEKEYGLPNLWPFLSIDRTLMMDYTKLGFPGKPKCSHEEMMSNLQVKCRTVLAMLKEAKPDFALFSAVGAMGGMLLYWFCKKLGIATMNIVDARIRERVIITDNCYEQFTDAYKIFDALQRGIVQSPLRGEAAQFLKDFRENPFPRVYEPPDTLGAISKFFRWLKFFIVYITTYIKEARWRDYLSEGPITYFRKRLIRRLRKWRGYAGLFEQPKKGEEFAFFPLHEDPEIATLLLAPFYVNQIALIQNIAKSLPVHFKLYVKEHPVMLYHRPRSYYQALKRIPNVRLIDIKESSLSLIQEAKLVLTITGTAGWEAVLLKKPVISFGSAFYNKLSMVKHSDEIEKLPYLVKECLEQHSHNEEELINFVSAILEDSVPLNYFRLWSSSTLEKILGSGEFRGFIDLLARKLKLEPNK